MKLITLTVCHIDVYLREITGVFCLFKNCNIGLGLGPFSQMLFNKQGLANFAGQLTSIFYSTHTYQFQWTQNHLVEF